MRVRSKRLFASRKSRLLWSGLSLVIVGSLLVGTMAGLENRRHVRSLAAYPSTFTFNSSRGLMSDRKAVWGFDQPSLATLRASDKKVFAHYFPAAAGVIRINNPSTGPNNDYWTKEYLSPCGEHGNGTCENGLHYINGGFVRQRPLPEPYTADPNYALEDFKTDVRRAIALGLDGFIWDTLRIDDVNGGYHTKLVKMLQAINAIDSNFKLILAPDNDDIVGVLTYYQQFYSNPAIYKLDDGRVLVEPFRAERTSATAWQNALNDQITAGYPTALLPMFVTAPADIAAYDSFVYGKTWWDTGAGSKASTITALHNAGLVYQASFAPQMHRPKNHLYREADGSKGYRDRWGSVIGTDTDMVQIVTWNDYTEDTVISPSTGVGYGFYDLSAYYIAWFKTGVEPTISRDVIQYYHRIESKDAGGDIAKQTKLFTTQSGTGAARDVIELLAFLPEAGTLEIDLGGQKYSENVSAGLKPVVMPSFATNVTPVFRLIRNNKTVIELTSAWRIRTNAEVLAYGWEDKLYRAGSSIPSPDIGLTRPDLSAVADSDTVTVTARETNGTEAATTSLAYIESGTLHIADQSFLEKIDDDDVDYKFWVKAPGFFSDITAAMTHALSASSATVALTPGDFDGDNAASLLDVTKTIDAFAETSPSSLTQIVYDAFGAKPDLLTVTGQIDKFASEFQGTP